MIHHFDMHIMPSYTALAFALLFQSSISGKLQPINLDSFSVDYGQTNVVKSSSTHLQIKLDSNGNGARLTAQTSPKGRICSDIFMNPESGAAFAMYVSSGEPDPANRANEKWDELDFEFPGGLQPGHFWFNVFHDGKDLPGVPVPSGHSSFSGNRYCISWDIAGSKNAIFSIDGTVVKAVKLNGWTKPLKPYLSYWGIAMGSPASSFLGGQRTNPETFIASAQNVAYDLVFTELPLPSS